MKTRRLAGLTLIMLVLGISSATALANNEGNGPARKRTSLANSYLIRAAAEVVAINPATRTLTLKREDGNTVTVVADNRVSNFAQVSVGDIVVAQYGHARAISLKKLPAAQAEGGTVANAPARPSAQTRPGKAKRELIADIIAIDDRTGQATLKGQNGEVVDVIVANRKLLAAVRVGERVRLEYTDAIAVAIKPAGKAIPPKRHHSP